MISRLSGTLLEFDPTTHNMVIDVGGVGYDVEVSANVLQKGVAVDEAILVHTHMVVREDAQLLFGFASKAERELFRAFIRISGVGPKLGLALISVLEPQVLVAAVRSNDISALTRVPGVGKKTAERLMVELKNRLEDLTTTFDVAVAPITPHTTPIDSTTEAVDALVALGYRPLDAQSAVAQALRQLDATASVQEIIRQSLRGFAQSGAAS